MYHSTVRKTRQLMERSHHFHMRENNNELLRMCVKYGHEDTIKWIWSLIGDGTDISKIKTTRINNKNNIIIEILTQLNDFKSFTSMHISMNLVYL